MDDLISRQAAIDALGEPFVMSQCMTMEECEHMNFARALCIARIESIEPVQRWIPVTERLPEENERVLLYVRNWAFYNDVGDVYEGTIHEGFFGPRKKVFVWYLSDVGREVTKDDVTHWMPLPEPPKEEP